MFLLVLSFLMLHGYVGLTASPSLHRRLPFPERVSREIGSFTETGADLQNWRSVNPVNFNEMFMNDTMTKFRLILNSTQRLIDIQMLKKQSDVILYHEFLDFKNASHYQMAWKLVNGYPCPQFWGAVGFTLGKTSPEDLATLLVECQAIIREVMSLPISLKKTKSDPMQTDLLLDVGIETKRKLLEFIAGCTIEPQTFSSFGYARTIIETIDIVLEFGLTTLASQPLFQAFVHSSDVLPPNLFSPEIDGLVQRLIEMIRK